MNGLDGAPVGAATHGFAAELGISGDDRAARGL